MVVYTWPRPCFPRQLVREPTACLFQQSPGFPWPDDWGPSMHCKLKTASKSSWGWSEDTLTSSQHLSILFEIHVIPCVSNYLDPVVFLNPQRGRTTIKIWKTSLYYSLVFVSQVDGSLLYSVSNCFSCWLARLWTVMSCKTNPRLRRFLIIVVSRAKGTV